jgi:predicted DNA-binding transcriptional regulator YafY
MAKKDYILRYLLILKHLRQGKRARFTDIANNLEVESEIYGYKTSLSKRTFQRDLNEIRTIFNIDIKCDRTDHMYYIDDFDNEDINARFIESFDLLNSFDLIRDVKSAVQIEKKNPTGSENLYGVLHAFKNNLIIEIVHKKYWNIDSTTRLVEPYGVKEFKGRWYLVGLDHKSMEIRVFGMDRIVEVQFTKTKYKIPSSFSIEGYFKDCYGIINESDKKPQKVLLEFDWFQAHYIKSNPLHHSQKVIQDEGTLIIELFLKISHDFVLELLSHGSYLKVLEPTELANTIKDMLQSTIVKY